MKYWSISNPRYLQKFLVAVLISIAPSFILDGMLPTLTIALDDRTTPIDTDFTLPSHKQKIKERTKKVAVVDVFKPIRCFKKYGFSIEKEKDNFFDEMDVDRAEREAHYRVLYHPNKTIQQYEYYNKRGELILFVKYYYVKEQDFKNPTNNGKTNDVKKDAKPKPVEKSKPTKREPQIDKTVLFNSFGMPKLVQQYHYSSSGNKTERIETFELSHQQEVVFLDEPKLLETIGVLTRIQEYVYPTESSTLVEKIIDWSVSIWDAKSKSSHTEAKRTRLEDNKQYESFKEVYHEIKTEQEKNKPTDPHQLKNLSHLLHYYNEKNQLVRKEQYFNNSLTYYFIYYYNENDMIKKEMYSSIGDLEQTYTYD